jgi:hypothetical protein
MALAGVCQSTAFALALRGKIIDDDERLISQESGSSMKRTYPILFGALLLAVGCDGRGAIQEGDTITPLLASRAVWNAGEAGDLKVILRCKNKETGRARKLDFDSVPDNVNPVATVTFYHGDKAEPPVTVILDHRC